MAGTWRWIRATPILGGDGGYVAVDPGNTSILYAENTGLSIQKSTDGGANFADATSGITESPDDFLFIAPFTMDPGNSQRLWTGGFYLWRTTNGAASWSRASAITAGGGSVSAIAVAPTDGNRVLAGMSDGIIHRTAVGLSANAGTVWPNVQPRTGYVSSLAFDPSNADLAYATYSTFGGTHVWKSLDGGASWAGIDGAGTSAIPDIPVHSIVVDPTTPSRLYVGTDLGVFVSRDGGGSWAVENTGFANVITEALAVGNVGATASIFAFTHGRGAWRVTSADANPVPAVSSLDPSSAPAGSSGFTLTVNGSDFVSTSIVRWNGSDRSTTFVSSGQLQAAIPAGDIASEGTAAVSVFTPPPGGGVSNALTFTITAATAAEIILDNASVGVQDGQRTFTGTWCVSGATGFFGTDSLYSCGGGADTYRWRPTIPAAGSYDVYVWWTVHVNRSTAVPITVVHAGGTTTRTFNEQVSGGQWVLHGRYSFNAGTGGYVQVSDSAGQAAADAVR
ncbi:MAG: hypothetical protein HYY95_14160, partial [Candidatus Rokubacteria bacterium]|nr:hypothetical protein [Candidatus Rokubacteria bacterium]